METVPAVTVAIVPSDNRLVTPGHVARHEPMLIGTDPFACRKVSDPLDTASTALPSLENTRPALESRDGVP